MTDPKQPEAGVSRWEAILGACTIVDWGQVLANGGPPCFHLMAEGDLCLRAKSWPGHGVKGFHDFVPLYEFARQLLDSQEQTIAELRKAHQPVEANAHKLEQTIKAADKLAEALGKVMDVEEIDDEANYSAAYEIARAALAEYAADQTADAGT